MTLKVLIIDDEDAVRLTQRTLLTSAGYEVAECDSAAAALDLLSQSTFDLVLSDHMLPNMSGARLARTLRSKGMATPFILLTGYHSLITQEQIVDGDINAVLIKPIRFDTLAATISQVICKQSENASRVTSTGPDANQDIDYQHYYDQLRLSMSKDSLTGCINRRELENRIARLVMRADIYDAHLLYVDFDRFRAVNESLGFNLADDILNQLAKALDRVVRSEGTVARLAGDEFAVLLENTTRHSATELANRVINHLRQEYFQSGDLGINVTASIGVTHIDTSLSVETLLRRAQSACRVAKKNGGDCYYVQLPLPANETEKLTANQPVCPTWQMTTG